ncbi:MAG TPA: hypothetical protein VFG14_18665 [Chthoniobacteraceae bacterium]|nr:hypothetical protein [Chthoniobacteraceae bacterium]
MDPDFRKPFKSDVQITIQIQEVVDIVRGFTCDNVIFTGGEPLLQQAGIVEAMRVLRTASPRMTFEIETNGTLVPIPDLETFEPQYNVSPKLSNAEMRSEFCLVNDALRFFTASPRGTFKFVCSDEVDLAEVAALVRSRGLPRRRVLLSPEATTAEQLAAKRLWLFEACVRLGFRYSDRLHVALFNTRRGV